MHKARRWHWLAGAFALAAGAASAQPAREQPANHFNDPFAQVTTGIADCPPQPGPLITLAERRAQEHGRVERGTSCYRSGRCRLPNAYLYDAEIIPRVRQAILYDDRFADTSVWVEGQRRWVWLRGCVRQPEQAAALEQIVRSIDDVEAVINELVVRPPDLR
ncbi:MAG: transporter [Rhodoferax sp.]|nr:transporter [Rhodoferax sp.]